ncbi:hypothetical protein CDV31_015785 [Fusarium ambrosium]|uniref:Uncharacterized protein n=1 Tax=Fusarium ambrosium TaxID=131363 RepID=A0A428SJL1_9HYPO|nr:hypothetical protein CDV31_015785 [Fusarium ambrosium]
MDGLISNPSRLQDRQPRKQPKKSSVSAIKTFLRALPKGEEDWDDKKPRTQEGIEQLRNELALSKIDGAKRAEMDSQTLLKAFTDEHATLLEDTRSQIHAFVFIALGEVAIGLGFRAKTVNEMVANYMRVPETSARTMRLGVRRWIKASDVLRRSWLGRADELPFRRNKFAHSMKKLPDEAINILGDMKVLGDHAVLEDVLVYIPKRQLSSGCLRLPNIVYDLYGGRVR